MAKLRRLWTPEQKAEIAAYSFEHGVAATMAKYNIKSESQMRRYRREAGEKVALRRKWTPKKIKGVLEYHKTHSILETRDHFKISTAQLHMWKNSLPANYYEKHKKKANGAGNGAGVLNGLNERDALMWLERWRTAYLDRVKAELPLATDVLAALRGGKG